MIKTERLIFYLAMVISVNVAKEGIKEIKKKFLNANTSEDLQKLYIVYILLPQQMAAVIQSTESYIKC